MNPYTVLDDHSLQQLGFQFDGTLWTGIIEKFALKLEQDCFYVYFNGHQQKYPYENTVGELEKQYYEKTGQHLI